MSRTSILTRAKHLLEERAARLLAPAVAAHLRKADELQGRNGGNEPEKPDPVKARAQRAHAHIARGELDRAELVLWEILRKRPRAPGSTYNLGLTLLMQGRYDDAKPVIDRAYRLRPRLSDRVLDRFPEREALEHLRAVWDRFPDWGWPEYQLRRERYRGVDVSLGRAVEHLVNVRGAPPSFVQVGTNAGNDLLQKCILKHDLRGLFVEPQLAPLEKMMRRYEGLEGFIFENCAITEEDGPVEFHTSANRTSLGSLTPDRNLLANDKNRTVMTVQGRTFEAVMQKHGIQSFSVFQVDTEGYDYRILRQVDLTKYRTEIVRMEFYLLPIAERIATFDTLDDHGFAYFYDGMDLVALRKATFESAFCLVDYLGECS